MDDPEPSFDPGIPEAPPSLSDPLPAETPDLPQPDSFLGEDGISVASNTVWPSILLDPTSGPWVTAPSGGALSLTSAHFWNAIFSSAENATAFEDSTFTTAATSDDERPTTALGLVPPSSASPTLLSQTLPMSQVTSSFGFGSENTHPTLQHFLDTVNQTGTLALKANFSPGARNAAWFVPDSPYRIAVSIQFLVDDAGFLGMLQTFLTEHYGLSLALPGSDPRMTFTSVFSYSKDSTDPASWAVSINYQLDVIVRIGDFSITTTFAPSGLEMIISGPPEGLPDGVSIIDQLSTAITAPSAPSDTSIPRPGRGGAFNEALSAVDLWYITINRSIDDWQLPTGDEPALPVYGETFWQIALLVDWRNTAIGLTFDTRTSAFTGELLFKDSVSTTAVKRSYVYRWQTDVPSALALTLPSRDPHDPSPGVDLWSLFHDSGDHPQLPSRVVEAKVSYRKSQDDDSSIFGMAANAISVSGLISSTGAAAAPSGFSWDSISVSAAVQTVGQNATIDFQAATAFSLTPPPGSLVVPAILRVNMEYYSGGFWLLHGRVEHLSAALLYQYFSNDVNSSAIGVLGKLELRDLDMLYTLQEEGPSSFLITGTILLGELELDLIYQYASGLLSPGSSSAAAIAWDGNSSPGGVEVVKPDGSASRWEFKASLGTTSRNSTVGSVVNSISANAATTLPKFVSDIRLAPRSSSNDFVKLDLSGGEGNDTLFVLWLTVLQLSLTFISVSPPTGSTKRVLRISVDEIPLISDIPAIKELPQPFDKLLYLWVDDDSEEGLGEEEVKSINAALTKRGMDINPLIYKQTAAGAPAIAAGHHFMVLDKNTVVLDHRFDNMEAEPTSSEADASPGPSSSADIADGASSEPVAAPTKGNLDKQLPFLSISAVSLLYRKPSLVLSLDATVVLGPITFTVIGFEIDLDLSDVQLDNLADLVNHLSVSLRGLSVKIDNPPLLIAGVFIHEVTNTAGVSADIFKGGLALGFETWQFLAVGEYASIVPLSAASDSTPYKSVFVFAKLDGPLITLTFATISGVRVGFGYNSLVRSPSVQELSQHPFLSGKSDAGAGNDPLQILRSMTDGANGIAPWGLTVTAFGILSVTAVLMLGFRESGVVISVLANGIAQMPPAVPSNATLFYVEVDMIAEMNTIEGYFSVQAALAPTSHVLVSSCRLTGGFALVNWFKPSVHAGDFVFTVGGYHRAYTPPPWYPVPERLGVSFTLGSMINVTGNVYFAITPKCVMGGGSLHLGLDVGPVSAWLDIILDVFIQFKPFHYTADLSVSVGCAVSIKVWFVHIRISVSVGAALHIEGPNPFGGFANVDFYVCSFTIHFGGSIKPPDPIPLQEFYDIAADPGARAEDTAASTTNDSDLNTTKIKFTMISGLSPPEKVESTGLPNTTTSATTAWRVKPGTFSFNIGVDFALSDVTLLSRDSGGKILVPLFPPFSSAPPPSFYSKPMHLTDPIKSTLTITVWKNEANDRQIVPGFTGSMVMKDVPVSLWGMYDVNEDPAGPSSSPPGLKNAGGPTMNLCLGVQLIAPPPTLVVGPVGSFYPAVAFREMLNSKPLPSLDKMQVVFLAGTAHDGKLDAAVRWNDVKTDWQVATETGKKILDDQFDSGGSVISFGFTSLLVEKLGWDRPPPNGKTKSSQAGSTSPPEWRLQTRPPNTLIMDLERTYQTLPLYAAAAI